MQTIDEEMRAAVTALRADPIGNAGLFAILYDDYDEDSPEGDALSHVLKELGVTEEETSEWEDNFRQFQNIQARRAFENIPHW